MYSMKKRYLFFLRMILTNDEQEFKKNYALLTGRNKLEGTWNAIQKYRKIELKRLKAETIERR